MSVWPKSSNCSRRVAEVLWPGTLLGAVAGMVLCHALCGVLVLRIERTREIKGQISVEIAYFVTSLPVAEAGPERLLALARAHWGIENKLHWRRDVSMNEDRCRVRAGARPLASIRNLALAMMKGTSQSVPAARETYAADTALTLAAVTGRIL